MYRTTSLLLLLLGLGGCLNPSGPSGPAPRKVATAKQPTDGLPVPPGTGSAPTTPQPTPTKWAANPAHQVVPPPSPRPLPPGASLPGPVATGPAAPPTGPAEPPAGPLSPAALAQSVSRSASPLPTETAPPKGPPALPPGIASASTPGPEVKPASPIQQVAHVPLPGQPTPAPEEGPTLTTAPPTAPARLPTPPATRDATPVPDMAQAGKAGAPLVRLVNSKRITLNFQVQNVGISGLSTVELWYTQDGRDWKKYDAPTQAKAYDVEVDEEGMYGFTLCARSGLGLGKEPPKAGDQPQVWVIVDLTKPDVTVKDVTVKVVDKVQQVSINWKATDKNMARQPVTLSYAEKADGPWTVIAAGVENSGQYTWSVPAEAPAKFFVRVEAIDLAGNTGRGQTAQAVLLDQNKPEVLITNIEANPGR